jgi:hypothetical protein
MTNILIVTCLLLSIKVYSQEVAPLPKNDSVPTFSEAAKQKHAPPWFVRRFEIGIGAFVPINNTEVRVGTHRIHGTKIDFEDDLGYKTSVSTGTAEFQWRISRRSRIDFNYYVIDRDSHYKIEKTLTFGEHIYNIDTEITTFFDTDIYKVSYGYALVLHPRYEIGVMIGAHIVTVDVGVGIDGELAYADDFEFTAPLPDFGIWGDYAINKKLSNSYNASFLKMEIDDLTGSIISYNFQIIFGVVPNVNIAFGYTGLNFEVDLDRKRLEGYFKWSYNGPSFTASYSFGKKIWKNREVANGGNK